MVSSGASVLTVSRPSPAARAGLRKGDVILECNGRSVTDWVDLLSCSGTGTVVLRVKRGLSSRNITLKRKPGEELGLVLGNTGPRPCSNRCLFCFIDQQPPGLRASLAVKDDDVRYSFLRGTYITLTDNQIDEAIQRGFNSLHVSVHAVDPVIRGRILGRSLPMPVLSGIDRLAEHSIEVQAQVVEIPGLNSGAVLEETIRELSSRNNVSILGVVPVGLTKHREKLFPLARHTCREAEETLDLIKGYQRIMNDVRGFPWVFAADEYYLATGRSIPPPSHYSRCTLQANGIGLLSAEREACRDRDFTGGGTVITGGLACPFVKDLLKGTGYDVLCVTNRLMGAEVGVAGLLGGEDVLNALSAGTALRTPVYIPSVMLNHQGRTLDELTLKNITERSGLPVTVLESLGDLP